MEMQRVYNYCKFINPPPLPSLCEISGALHLAQPGITAGWQYQCRVFRVKPIGRLFYEV